MAQAKMDFIINTKLDKTAFNELKREIQRLNTLTGKDLVNMGVSKNLKEANAQLAEIKASASQVETALNKAFSIKLGTVNLSKFNNELKSMNLKTIANDFNKVGSAGSAAFRTLATNVLTAKTQLVESHKVLEEMGKTMMNTVKWGISSSVWNTFTGSIEKAYFYTKNLDRSLNNIRIVAKQSAEEMNDFAVKANLAAKNLGKTTLDYTNAALIYYQQGLPEADVEERAAVTLKMANVTGEAAQDVSDYMTSIWNNFKEGSQTVEYYADVLTALGAATASSTDEIAAGLEKFSAVADTVGLSYEYATAALATVTAETRQSADIVGTAFKTLFSRIQDLELGETLDDGTTLGKYSEALMSVGINIKKTNGELKDMDIILDEMGAKWQTLSKDQQVALAQTVAGTRQYNQLIGLMANYDTFKENIEIAKNATGELTKQQEIYMKSTAAHLDKLQASAERLYKNLIDSDGVNSLIDLFSGLVTGVSEYVEAIGGSGPILSQFGALLLNVFGKTFSQSIATTISNFKILNEQAEQINAQLELLQRFKGIEINDGSYTTLLNMVEGLNTYKNALTEDQMAEANMIIQRRNELANEKEAWDEARISAEAYFQKITGESIDLTANYSTDQAQDYIDSLLTQVNDYEITVGEASKRVQKLLTKDFNLDAFNEELANAQNLLDSKFLTDEGTIKRLRDSIKDMETINIQDIIDSGSFNDEQKRIIKQFQTVFGNASDQILSDVNKTKKVILQSINGAGDAFQNEINQVDQAWDLLSQRFKTQYIAQGILEITSQVTMLATAINSISNIPSIWDNENLSTGEKIIQTLMVTGNVANGVAQSFKMIHTSADLLRKTVLKSTIETGISTIALEKNKDAQNDLNDEIKNSEKIHDKSQKEIQETSQAVALNSNITNNNTQEIQKNTAARVENNKQLQFGFEGDNMTNPEESIPQLSADEIRNSEEYQKQYKRYLAAQKGKITKDNKKKHGQLSLDADFDIEKNAQEKTDKWWINKKPKDKETLFPNLKETAEDVNNVTEAIEDLGEKGGNKKQGVFDILKQDFASIGKVLKSIPPQVYLAAGATVAAIGIIAVAVKTLYDASQAEIRSIENLRVASEDFKKEAEELRTKADNLKSDFNNYLSLVDILNSCTKNSQEWKDALVEVNNTALELLNKYPSLLKVSDLFKNDGTVSILNKDVVNAEIEKYEKEALIAESASMMARVRANKKENDRILNGPDNFETYAGTLEGHIMNIVEQEGFTRSSSKILVKSEDRSTGHTDSSVGSNLDQQKEIHEATGYIRENLHEYALMTEEQIKADLQKKGLTEDFSAALAKETDYIQDLSKQTNEVSQEMSNYAKFIAGLYAKEGEGSLERRAREYDAIGSDSDKYDEVYERLTGEGISKVSGRNNEIVKETLEELQGVAGYENFQLAESNVVRGTDTKDRRIAFQDESGNTIVLSAEKIATLIAQQEYANTVANTDYESEANEVREKFTEETGLAPEDANKLLEIIASGDYSNLTQEEATKYQEKLKDIDLSEIFTKEELSRFLGFENVKWNGKNTQEDFADTVNKSLKDIADKGETLEQRKARYRKSDVELTEAESETLKDLDYDEDAFKNYVKLIRETNEELLLNPKAAKEVAMANVRMNKGLKDLGEGYEDWLKTLKKSGKDTPEYAEALTKTENALKKIFNTDVIPKDFVENNKEKIKQLAEGNLDVLDDLQKEMAKNTLEIHFGGKDKLTEDAKAFINQINALDLGNIEIGTSLDSTGLTAAFQELINKSGMTAEEVNNLLGQIGFEPEITYQDMPIKNFTSSDNGVTYTAEYPDPNNPGQTKTYTLTSEQYGSYGADGVVSIPIINGKTTAFTGANIKGVDFSNLTGGKKNKNKGSKSKPKKENKLDKEKDRYHDVDIELKQISNNLEKVQKQTEKLTGSDLIENWAKQFKLLNNEIDTTKDKIKIAQGEQAELQKKLSAKGVKFNADGTISNYLSLYDKELAKVNAMISKYNKMSAKQQDKYQEKLDKAKEDFDKLIEDIERYDEVVTDLIPGLEETIQDVINKQIELKLEAFNLEITLKLETKDAELEWNDFKKTVLDDIDELDIFGNTKARLQDFNAYFKEMDDGLIQVATKHINDILSELKTIDEGGKGKVYYDDQASAVEDLKEYYTTLMTNLREVHDLSDEIHDSYLSMMDEVQNKFDEQINAYSTISDLIEHDKNIITMLYGEEAYSALSQFYDRQEENNNKQLDFQKQQVEFWANQMTLVEEGSEEWDKAKENWMAAVSEWNSAVEAAIKNLQDKYLNAINEIFQKLNNEVTNGLGLDYVETQWDLVNRNAEEYLDSVNAIYNVQQLQSKYLDAIEQHDSASQQKKLNDLMEQEIGYLREQDKLSQYDIDRANLKYEIALKQIALEEAQQNKTQLRLRRDSQGNYTYQYTQDDDQVSSIQQEIADLYNQLYNLDAEEYRGNLEGLYDVWVEFQEKMAEAAQINDPEQRAAKELLIKEQYGELINTLAEKNELIQSNLNQSTMSHLFDLYNQNIENYDMMTAEQQAILSQFITEETDFTNAAFDNLFGLYNTTVENFQGMSNAQRDILIGSIVPQWETAVQAMADKFTGEGGFIPVCSEAFNQLDIATKEYENSLNILQESAGQTFEDIKNGINPVIIQTEQLAKNNNELINTYGQELEAIQSVIDELDSLKIKYAEAAKAAEEATKKAYEYWSAATNKNANEDVGDILNEPFAGEEENKTDEAKKTENTSTNTSTNALGTASNGAPFITEYTIKKGDNLSKIGAKYGVAWKRIYQENKSVIGSNPNYIKVGKKLKIPKYDTGGYTGDWANNDGQLAMLHKKELVLNASDTKNMLNAIEIVREITNNLGASLMSKMAGISAIKTQSPDSGILEQNVHITAEFPNVENSREIEDALNNLVNKASQYIQK